MYEVYSYKQPQNGFAVSPPTNVGMTSNPTVNQGITIKQGIGITSALSRVYPVANKIVTIGTKASGSLQKQKRLEQLSKGISFGTTAFTLGVPTALAVEAISFGVEQYDNYVTNQIDTVNQEYQRKLNGAAVDKFVGRGKRYD